MKPTDPEFRRAYQRIWRYAKNHGLPTKGIYERLLKDGIPPKVVKAKTPEFQREYARRMAHARYHGLPTEGILDGLRREFAEAGKPYPKPCDKSHREKSTTRRAARETAPLLTDEDVERWAAEVNRKVKADLAELRKRHEAEERERRALERQERKERRAEIRREWNEYRKTKTCHTCKHAFEKGVQTNGTSILACRVTGFGTMSEHPACTDYDEEYINAIYDI